MLSLDGWTGNRHFNLIQFPRAPQDFCSSLLLPIPRLITHRDLPCGQSGTSWNSKQQQTPHQAFLRAGALPGERAGHTRYLSKQLAQIMHVPLISLFILFLSLFLWTSEVPLTMSMSHSMACMRPVTESLNT
eukprot:215231-Pelagomonas_calceolata.AAC.9